MSCRGKVMVQMAMELLSEKDKTPCPETVVVAAEGETATNIYSQNDQSFLQCAGPILSYEPVAGPSQLSSSSSSSSRSSQSSSSSSSSSFSEDSDDSVKDVTYDPEVDEQSLEVDVGSNDNTIVLKNDYGSPSGAQDVAILTSPNKKGLKRKQNTEKWKRNILKKLRNSGIAYEKHTESKAIRAERKIKPPCGEKCKLQCSTKFSDNERERLFSAYWNLGDVEKQRQFIANSMKVIQPKYRYVRFGGTRSQRRNNNAFYFTKNNENIRVCKLFFKNTLDINDRPIRTVLEKKNKVADVLLEPDLRGKHGNQKSIDPIIREGIRKHIDSIPKIESHYTRANTSRLFIDGSKSIADIHKDYVANCKEEFLPYANYVLFYRIFTQEYNLSFFTPKKDLCDTCAAYENVENKEKERLKDNYEQHLVEKDLSRCEKKTDKENSDVTVAVYDLQAVMQLPKGDVSQFYYKSKLNVFNFTIYDLKSNKCECFVWDEGNGHRGVNELGTCVLEYLKKLATTDNIEVIFYSDNCAGQQKNKFMLALYLYAVQYFSIKSITHKYLIKGHTQNEGDSAHSLIERQVKRLLKSGPMYTPEAFINAIRTARKTGQPFHVNELCYDDFYDLKDLASNIGPLNTTTLKMSEIKVLKVVKESPTSVFYKHSYSEDFKEATVIKRKKKVDTRITLRPAFQSRPGIPQKKKEDLLDLVKKNFIPKYYRSYYENL